MNADNTAYQDAVSISQPKPNNLSLYGLYWLPGYIDTFLWTQESHKNRDVLYMLLKKTIGANHIIWGQTLNNTSILDNYNYNRYNKNNTANHH